MERAKGGKRQQRRSPCRRVSGATKGTENQDRDTQERREPVSLPILQRLPEEVERVYRLADDLARLANSIDCGRCASAATDVLRAFIHLSFAQEAMSHHGELFDAGADEGNEAAP